MPDIDADDLQGIRLQQAVGEAAGGLPDIETAPAGDVEAGDGQGAGQFDAATRDEAVVRVSCHGQRRIPSQFQRRPGDDAAVSGNPPGGNHALCRRA